MNTAAHIFLQILFWSGFAAIFHSYVVYPWLVGRLARRKQANQQTFSPADPPGEWPYLVVVMAAHNEEAVLPGALRSLFAAEYPPERFEVHIAADNCADRTHDIVREMQREHLNLHLRIFPGRNGKIRVLNQLFAENRQVFASRGDFVMISCDANVQWSPQLPRRLARHFKNPKIGLVAANVLDFRHATRGIAAEEEAYVNRENRIKYHEGLVWGRLMGAFGACFAIRGRLFDVIPEHFIVDDFYHTLRCYELGYDGIVEPEAVCYEAVSEEVREEFRRKQRIAHGNFQNLRRFWRLLMPWHGGAGAAFAFWSHKGFRWLGPFFLAGLFLSSVALAFSHWIYAAALAGLCLIFAAATLDYWLGDLGIRSHPLRLIRYFLLMNLALFLGAIQSLKGSRSSVWEPTRRVAGCHLPPAPGSPPTPPAHRVPVEKAGSLTF